MKDLMAALLADGFHGKDTHVEPFKALRGLTASDARNSPNPKIHSVWASLYHIVFWQNITLKSMKGEKIDWKTVKSQEWPSPESMEEDENWTALIEEFRKGLDELKHIAKTQDFKTPIPAWNNEPILKGLLVEAQHNSYHIGHIVVARQLLGLWPPPEESE